jgi:hypothetical protein
LTRLYHSASSLALGDRCERAWWYQYVAGIREPRVEWATIAHYVADRSADAHGVYWWRDPAGRGEPVKSRQRSTALGTEMHSRFQAWHEHRPVNWTDLPGQIALSGAALVPHPQACTVVRTEAPIGDAAIVGATDSHAPPVGFRVAGIVWAGYRDLVVQAPAELARLGITDVADGWLLDDYKSSADIARYALTSAGLRDDFAANLYALATMTETGHDRLPARWTYCETKRVRRAAPVDAVITRSAATDAVMAGSERARHLDSLRLESDATPNTLACGDYGGCPHHHSVGGPCDARRSFGSIVQTLVKKEKQQMVLPAAIQERITPPNGAPAGVQFGAVPVAPVSTFGQHAGPPPAPVAPPPPPVAVAAPPPPAEEPPKARKPRQAAAPAAAPAPVAVAAADAPLTRTMAMAGNYGPLTLIGHPADVIDAYTLLQAAP